MKQTILLFALFISAISHGQFFPDLNPALLTGHKIKMREYTPEEIKKLATTGADNFVNYYADPGLLKAYKGSGYKTPIPELAGRVFTVEEVVNAKTMPGDTSLIFKLNDGKETIYYHYYETFTRQFEPVDFMPQPEYWDGYIQFSGTGDTDMLTGEFFGVFKIYTFLNRPNTKSKVKEDVNIMIEVPENGERGFGLKLYLEDGRELSFPKGFVAKSMGVKFVGSLSNLTKEELQTLSTVTITHVDYKDGKKPFKHGFKFKNVLARFLTRIAK